MYRVRDAGGRFRRRLRPLLPRAERAGGTLRLHSGQAPRQPAGRQRYGPVLRSCCPLGWALASRFVLLLFWSPVSDSFLGVGYRRRDHIGAAGPLAQIDNAAAVAAEREVRVAAFHGLLADGTAEFEGTLTRHTVRIVAGRLALETIRSEMVAQRRFAAKNGGLQNLRHQVVIVRLGDLAAKELARLRLRSLGEVVDEDLAVDFGSVHGGAAF